MYTVNMTDTAERELKKLDGSIKRVAISVMLNELPNFPNVTELKQLKHFGDDTWRKKFRRVWRMLFIVDEKQNTITVFKVGHRKDVYE